MADDKRIELSTSILKYKYYYEIYRKGTHIVYLTTVLRK